MKLSHGKITALLLCALLLLFTLCSGAVMALHGDHDCIGEQCEICLCLERAGSLGKLAGMVLFGVVTLIFLSRRWPAVHFDAVWPACFGAPVSLHVRMNH